MWSYKPLFRLLLEKDVKKSQLKELCGLNAPAIAKFSKNQPVNMETLSKICDYFNVGLNEIVEYIPNAPEKQSETHED